MYLINQYVFKKSKDLKIPEFWHRSNTVFLMCSVYLREGFQNL